MHENKTNILDEYFLPIHEQRRDEARLRGDHPGLQDLWDQYQTMLKLVTPAEQQ